MDSAQTGVAGVVVATIEGVAEDGRPLVHLAGGAQPLAARVVWMRDEPEWSECAGLRAVIAFEEGDEARPLVIGLLDAPPERALAPAPDQGSGDAPRVLHLKGERELLLECGKAKISLRADGRIVIRGGHLISRSSGPNKIRGGSVHIN